MKNDTNVNRNYNEVEFNSNILLMYKDINFSYKINCLSFISYINNKKTNALYTYYINNKIIKYFQDKNKTDKIDKFNYTKSAYNLIDILEKEKNYFYAMKYLKETWDEIFIPELDDQNLKLLNELVEKVKSDI